MEPKWGKTLDTQFVPYDKNGNQLNGTMLPWNEVTWKPNEVFADTLQFLKYACGWSGKAYFEFKRMSTRTDVAMFLCDFEDAVRVMNTGVLSGTFTFTKKGQRWGVKLLTTLKSE